MKSTKFKLKKGFCIYFFGKSRGIINGKAGNAAVLPISSDMYINPISTRAGGQIMSIH